MNSTAIIIEILVMFAVFTFLTIFLQGVGYAYFLIFILFAYDTFFSGLGCVCQYEEPQTAGHRAHGQGISSEVVSCEGLPADDPGVRGDGSAHLLGHDADLVG